MYRTSVRRLVLVIKGWACSVLICHQQKRTFGGWRTSSRVFAYFRVSYDILRPSWKRSSPRVATTVVVLKQPSLFGVLGSPCLTGSALLDCHVLKGFGIYMIGILDSLSDVWKASTGTRHVISSCNLLDNIQGS